MKAIFYLLLAVMLLSSAACKKAESGTLLGRELIGEWRYTGASGGLSGKYEKADPAINQILQFKSGLRYLRKTNDQVSEQGSYQLDRMKSIYTGKEDNAIFFNPRSNVTSKSIISLRNDTLLVADNFYDGYQAGYTRVK